MLTIALGFLRVAWPYILAALLLGAVYWKADHWCNSACQSQSKAARSAEGKIRTLEAQIAEAQERATALALLWSAQVDKTEAANNAAAKVRTELFTPIVQRANAIPRGVATLRLPDGAYSLWADSSRAANASRSASVREAGAGPVPAPAAANPEIDAADVIQWSVQAAAAYADAYGQWKSCVTFYTGLQGASNGH